MEKVGTSLYFYTATVSSRYQYPGPLRN